MEQHLSECATCRAELNEIRSLSVLLHETKEGDFGGEEKETYDVKEYRITDTEQQEKVFNFHGLLTSQTDEKGNKTTFNYNENFQLTKITSPTGLAGSALGIVFLKIVESLNSAFSLE